MHLLDQAAEQIESERNKTEMTRSLRVLSAQLDALFVELRIACPEVGYPVSEARYSSLKEFLHAA